MSDPVLFARHAKLRVDRAIHRAYRDLAHDRAATEALSQLLGCIRRRPSLLRRPDAFAVVDAVRNLARWAPHYVRPPSAWPGCSGSRYPVVASLARHLLGEYPVPAFLALVWYGDGAPSRQRKRRWYVDHARGARFRSLDLPMPMTRKMESLFLASPDHLPVETAMRRAEALALGASDALVAALLATRLGWDLSHAAFWRSVIRFFVRWEGELEPSQIAAIVDFLHGVRHDRLEVVGADGPVAMEPLEPAFSMAGRTPASLWRRVEAWHRELGVAAQRSLSWRPSPHQPLRVTSSPGDAATCPVIWELVELTSSEDLQLEGRMLRHCVASYAWDCWEGRSRIWSLRRRSGPGSVRPVLTIEIDPRQRAIVQARGLRNRPPSQRTLQLVEEWARRENLRVALSG